MQFFEALKSEKLADPAFESVYKRECNICGTTVKLVSALCSESVETETIPKTLGMDRQALTDLIEGDRCDPEQVDRLCRYLGIDASFKECPKWNRTAPRNGSE